MLSRAVPHDFVRDVKEGRLNVAASFFAAAAVVVVGFVAPKLRLMPLEIQSDGPGDAVSEPDTLDAVFAEFEWAAAIHGISYVSALPPALTAKIHTFQNTFVAAAGVPIARMDQTVAAVHFAMDAREVVRRRAAGGQSVWCRVAVYAGAAVGGVLTSPSLRYCLFGDASE